MKGKMLFIRYKKPSIIFEGGERSTEMHLNALTAIFGKENLDVYHIHEQDNHRTFADYLQGGILVFFNFHFGLTPSKVKRIINISRRYDYLFIDRSIFGILAKKAVEAGYQGKIIGFFHNIEKYYFNAKLPHFPGKRIIINCADKNDSLTCRYCDSIIALNQRDASIIQELYHRKPDLFLPVVLEDKYTLPSYPTQLTSPKPRCLFLGAYFPPNVDGLKWFVQNVFPKVDITLTVVGKSLEIIAQDYASYPDINIVSDAPDLRPFFENADIMVFPIFKGSGMKVKTCESLMYGKNIIGTSEAFEGYECDFARVGGKCNTADEFINAINQFSTNPKPIFNSYSRDYFLSHHTIQVAVSRLTSLFNE